MEKRIGDIVHNEELQQPSGGCTIQGKVKTPDEIDAERLGISVAKLQAAKAYAQALVFDAKRRGNKIKPSTVRAKVAKKFNLKMT